MATSRTVAATARPLETVMSESGDDFSVSRAAAYRGTMVLGSCPGLTCATRAHFNPYRLTSASSSCIRRSSGCPISMRTMPRSHDSLSSREMVGREYPSARQSAPASDCPCNTCERFSARARCGFATQLSSLSACLQPWHYSIPSGVTGEHMLVFLVQQRC